MAQGNIYNLPSTFGRSMTSAASSSSRILVSSNIDDCILVWLDNSANETRSEVKQFHRITNQIKIFVDTTECANFLKHVHVKVFLIVSGRLGEYFVPIVHSLSHIYSIFVFCLDKYRHERWIKDYGKIKGIFTEIEQLCTCLRTDARQLSNDTVHFEMISNIPATSMIIDSQYINKQDAAFMYAQLLYEILLETETLDEAKAEMVDFCQQQYADNNVELQHIDDFCRNSMGKTAVWFYTRESFLHQMLNKALRKLEINTLYYLRFFIKQLNEQLTKLHREQMVNDNVVPRPTLYRGQSMTRDEFEKLKLNKGGLLSFNSFLSTSTNSNVALQFAHNTLPANLNDEVTVLIEIDITSTINNSQNAYANITHLSSIPHENETLFTMGAVFRICSVEKYADNRIWHIRLTLTRDIDEQLEHLKKNRRKEIKGCHLLFRLGRLTRLMGEMEQSKIFFDLLLKKTTITSNPRHLAAIYNELGTMHATITNKQQSLDYFNRALTLQQQSLLPNDTDIALTFRNMADVYVLSDQLQRAHDLYRRSLDIELSVSHPNQHTIARCYNSISAVYLKCKDLTKALECYKCSLEHYRACLPANHPELADLYTNIGSVYLAQKNFKEALKYYEKALSIQLDTMMPINSSIAVTYHCLAWALLNQNRFSEALENAKKAADMFVQIDDPCANNEKEFVKQIRRAMASATPSRFYNTSSLSSYNNSEDLPLDTEDAAYTPNYDAFNFYSRHDLEQGCQIS